MSEQGAEQAAGPPQALSPKARIAYVDHASDTGGAEKSLLDILTRLDRSRFDPVLFCSEDAGWLEGPGPSGVTIERLFRPGGLLDRKRDDLGGGVMGSLRDLGAALRPVAALRQRFARLRPDVVHTNTLKTHLLAGAAAWLTGRRLVWHLRDLLTEGAALGWLRRAARVFRPRVIAISEAVRESFREADIRVIYNGTDLSSFQPLSPPERAAMRASLGLSAEDTAICIVGRLTPWKGHRELLRAFATVARACPGARLIVVGEIAFWEDDYEAELRQLAETLGVAPLVQWLGFRRDVSALLSAADVFALPSLDEPFGRAIVEAMACAKPVVATRSGGVPEIVAHEASGVLITPGDERELASALLRLLKDPELRRRMGEVGRARAASHFDVRRTVAQVEGLYEELLASR